MSASIRRIGSLVAVVGLLAGACSSGASPLPTVGPVPTAPASPSAGPSGPAPAATPLPPTANVTLALDWTPNTNHTGFYVAQQQRLVRPARRST